MFIKEPHTALFIVPTGVGKTHLALNLLEKNPKFISISLSLCAPR